ncbi:MAG: YciI family protein [Chloroflexota bacterium]|nr:YciI family protein [Chloroflexota bacterium]
MRYLLLIYTAESMEPPTNESAAAQIEAYDAYTREVKARGAYHAGEALHPTSSATTVRVRDGETLTTDGPYAETKEALGGFYLIDARDLDEAIELAAKIPSAVDGAIEVRPIFEFGADTSAAPDGAAAGG